MPYAQFMPTVVFPKTHGGNVEWDRWDKSEVTRPYFCDEYKQDSYHKRCERRNPAGEGAYNLCRRCIAGYLYDVQAAVEHTADALNV